MERVTFLTRKASIEAEDLGIISKPAERQNQGSGQNVPFEFSVEETDLKAMERRIILSALRSVDGNVSRAARKLNIGREALRYRMKKYNISTKVILDD